MFIEVSVLKSENPTEKRIKGKLHRHYAFIDDYLCVIFFLLKSENRLVCYTDFYVYFSLGVARIYAYIYI